MKNVLIATLPVYMDAIDLHLGKRFKLIFTTGLREAVSRLDEDLGLIACNVNFGEGQLYELLRAAKQHPVACHVPFLVVNNQADLFSLPIRQSIEIATQALGANRFIELASWRKDLGDEGAFEQVAAVMHQLLSDGAG